MMRIRTLMTLLVVFTYLDTKAQHITEVENKCVAIANTLMDSTKRFFVHQQSGERICYVDKYSSKDQLKPASDVLEWYYPNGLLHVALIKMARITGDEKYITYVKRNYDFIFSHYKLFKNVYRPGKPYESYFSGNYTPFWQMFMMSELDHCASMSTGLADLYLNEQDGSYYPVLQKTAHYIQNKQIRLVDGTLVRENPRKYTIWTDDLYMSVPFLARYAQISGDNTYLDDALLQVVQFHDHLFDSTRQIFHHFKYTDTVIEPFAYWGRANGWAAMAQAELLAHMPDSHFLMDTVQLLFQRHIKGLLHWQDETGMWHQLLDKPDSYLESSCTAMFIYAIAMGVNEGWLPQDHIKSALKAWQALNERFDHHQLKDICVGTPVGNDVEFYYKRPVSKGDTHGMAAFLMAGVEIIRYHRLQSNLLY